MKFSRFQKFALLFLASLIVILVLVKFSELKEIIKLLKQTNWIFIGLAVLLQALTYFSLASLYSSIFKIFHYRIPLGKLCRLAVASTFLNQIFPSAGLAGLTLITASLKKDGISKGKSTLTATVGAILIGTIFLFFLAVSIAYYLIWQIQMTPAHTIFFTAMLIIIVLVINSAFYLFRHKESLYRIMEFLSRLVNRLRRIFKSKKYTSPQDISFFIEEFYLGVDVIRQNKKKLIKPLACAIVFFFSDVLTLFFVFLAFGRWVKIGIIIIGFVLTDTLGFVVAIPTSLGVFELSMSAIFSNLGIPLASAVVATLIFRALTFWLPIPIGYFFYHSLIKEKVVEEAFLEKKGGISIKQKN